MQFLQEVWVRIHVVREQLCSKGPGGSGMQAEDQSAV